MKSLLVKVSLVFPLLLTPLSAIAQTTSATVVSIGDGDTLRIRQSGQVTTIRLSCVDTPERAQSPWGQQSTSRLKQLLPAGKAVQVREITRDHYGRTVAELYVGKQSINLQMVKDGQAAVYRQYLKGCTATKDQYLQAEAQAKQRRLGFWNQKCQLCLGIIGDRVKDVAEKIKHLNFRLKSPPKQTLEKSVRPKLVEKSSVLEFWH